jgi:hypothetical protein
VRLSAGSVTVILEILTAFAVVALWTAVRECLGGCSFRLAPATKVRQRNPSHYCASCNLANWLGQTHRLPIPGWARRAQFESANTVVVTHGALRAPATQSMEGVAWEGRGPPAPP